MHNGAPINVNNYVYFLLKGVNKLAYITMYAIFTSVNNSNYTSYITTSFKKDNRRLTVQIYNIKKPLSRVFVKYFY